MEKITALGDLLSEDERALLTRLAADFYRVSKESREVVTDTDEQLSRDSHYQGPLTEVESEMKQELMPLNDSLSLFDITRENIGRTDKGEFIVFDYGLRSVDLDQYAAE